MLHEVTKLENIATLTKCCILCKKQRVQFPAMKSEDFLHPPKAN